MGVTSRGASCYGNDNIWTRPDKFRDLINQAITYANATYLDEDGNVQDGTNTGGTGGTGGTAGMGGTGGSSGEAGSGGVDPGTGGTGGDIEPVPGCGNSGPCGPDSTCLVDSTTGDGICGRTCNEDLPCVEGVCDPTLGVCVTEGPQPKAADGDAGSDGSCGVSSPRGNKSGVAGLMLLLLGAVALRRRR
jgi:MYXO-CTERM domain-containing protein